MYTGTVLALQQQSTTTTTTTTRTISGTSHPFLSIQEKKIYEQMRFKKFMTSPAERDSIHTTSAPRKKMLQRAMSLPEHLEETDYTGKDLFWFRAHPHSPFQCKEKKIPMYVFPFSHSLMKPRKLLDVFMVEKQEHQKQQQPPPPPPPPPQQQQQQQQQKRLNSCLYSEKSMLWEERSCSCSYSEMILDDSQCDEIVLPNYDIDDKDDEEEDDDEMELVGLTFLDSNQ